MPHIGAPELLIVLLIVIFIFGVGKLPEIGGAFGKGIREFRKAVTDSDDAAKSAGGAEPKGAKAG
jgi:sec-independent protein translocase protein TatA